MERISWTTFKIVKKEINFSKKPAPGGAWTHRPSGLSQCLVLFHWAIQTIDMTLESIPHFICNIFECKFKSCPRDSLHILWKKFILNINLELILHYISCGVKRIPPNVQTNISKLLMQQLFAEISAWNKPKYRYLLIC